MHFGILLLLVLLAEPSKRFKAKWMTIVEGLQRPQRPPRNRLGRVHLLMVKNSLREKDHRPAPTKHLVRKKLASSEYRIVALPVVACSEITSVLCFIVNTTSDIFIALNVVYVLFTGFRTERGKSSGPKSSSAGGRAGPRGKAPNQRPVSAPKSAGAKKQAAAPAEGNHWRRLKVEYLSLTYGWLAR